MESFLDFFARHCFIGNDDIIYTPETGEGLDSISALKPFRC
ncbi:MAG: hypothetical protein PUD26_11100 [bacterium]|nr:hypothetical protein [bacterium]MDD6027120.1 hypothetical protein [bacterium]